MIRRAKPEDLGMVFHLAKDFATSFALEESTFRASFMGLLSDSESYFAVAEVDGEIIGYVLGFIHRTLYANGRVVWVEEIMVGTSYRRQGVGRELMQHVESWASDEGCKLIALATRRAASFYEALEYQASATYFRKLL